MRTRSTPGQYTRSGWATHSDLHIRILEGRAVPVEKKLVQMWTEHFLLAKGTTKHRAQVVHRDKQKILACRHLRSTGQDQREPQYCSAHHLELLTFAGECMRLCRFTFVVVNGYFPKFMTQGICCCVFCDNWTTCRSLAYYSFTRAVNCYSCYFPLISKSSAVAN